MEPRKHNIIIYPTDGYIPQSNLNIHTENLASSMSGVDSTVSKSLDEVLNLFESISLDEMDNVKLMNRVDTKFLLSFDKILVILRKAVEHYRILEIEEKRLSPYSSIYFDTDDVQMYTMHHNGKLNRYKVRMRSYVDSGDSYLEIKKKNNKGRTRKRRIRIDKDQFNTISLNEPERLFIREKSPYDFCVLKPQLQNYFNRITLVDKNETERITIDIGLNFRKIGFETYTKVDGLVIVEIKQDGASDSYFRRYLNELSVLPKSMSKYCLGMVLMNPDLKNNRFKTKLRLINKITNNNVTD